MTIDLTATQTLQQEKQKHPGLPSRVSFRTLVVAVVILTTGASISRKSPELIISDLSGFANSIARDSLLSYGAGYSPDERSEEPTGVNLHLSDCGVTWDEYYTQLPAADPDEQSHHAFQWTISGGDEYRNNAGIILEKWKTLGIEPVLVVALEESTALRICEQGYFAVHWNALKASYSRVADAKFAVAASVAERGYRGFFIEMDIFCRKNPVPVFLKQKQDLINIGHNDVGYFVNIGSFMAAPKMGPFFRGLLRVLSYSLENRQHTNQANWTVDFFDQNIYKHCLPLRPNEDDDALPFQFEFYLFSDTERKNDLLRHCQHFQNFSHYILPHHVMASHDPPTIFDSTYCIHPLASVPFTPLAFKMGTAKFFGWDPKPISPDEKLLKLFAGDIELNNCWNRVINHDNPRMDEYTFYDKIAMLISVLVEIAEFTNRTLVLPQYIRSKESWGLPTHGIVDVRTLGVPYRVMTRQQSYEWNDENTAVMNAAHNFSETFRRATDTKYADVKMLSINKICNVRDYKLEVLEERRKKMKWCFDKDQEWNRAMGAWMDFCDAL
jgi:hypothetical protein